MIGSRMMRKLRSDYESGRCRITLETEVLQKCLRLSPARRICCAGGSVGAIWRNDLAHVHQSRKISAASIDGRIIFLSLRNRRPVMARSVLAVLALGFRYTALRVRCVEQTFSYWSSTVKIEL